MRQVKQSIYTNQYKSFFFFQVKHIFLDLHFFFFKYKSFYVYFPISPTFFLNGAPQFSNNVCPVGMELFNQMFEFREFLQNTQCFITSLLRRNGYLQVNRMPRTSTEYLFMLLFPVSGNSKNEAIDNSLPTISTVSFLFALQIDVVKPSRYDFVK